jgi:flagellar biosynthesis/type III secretory pathway chaperone
MLNQIKIEMEDELQSLYESLISVLKEEIDAYGELYIFFLSEREILIKSSAEELSENNSRKEACIVKAGMLDEERGELVEKISKLLDMDEQEEVCISALIPYGDDHQQNELKECQSRLCSIVVRVNEINEKNKVLLSSSLLYVRKSIDFISRLMSSSSTYQNTGELKVNNLNGKIVCREG